MDKVVYLCSFRNNKAARKIIKRAFLKRNEYVNNISKILTDYEDDFKISKFVMIWNKVRLLKNKYERLYGISGEESNIENKQQSSNYDRKLLNSLYLPLIHKHCCKKTLSDINEKNDIQVTLVRRGNKLTIKEIDIEVTIPTEDDTNDGNVWLFNNIGLTVNHYKGFIDRKCRLYIQEPKYKPDKKRNPNRKNFSKFAKERKIKSTSVIINFKDAITKAHRKNLRSKFNRANKILFMDTAVYMTFLKHNNIQPISLRSILATLPKRKISKFPTITYVDNKTETVFRYHPYDDIEDRLRSERVMSE
uniref:ORF70 n=1 Tax=Malaco herpesvirus 2 TaxID=3031798 RepID=A0AA48P7M2_9VIRU|nr:TPA_asm: ORF70 [Malaco herpesvirus 2]